jgi:mannosyltransferase OCH1-like enzyme
MIMPKIFNIVILYNKITMNRLFILCILIILILILGFLIFLNGNIEDFSNNVSIPKRIFQTHKSNEYILNNPKLKKARESWTKHSDFEYNFYDDNKQDEFMKTNFSDIYDVYSELPLPVMKGDLWRYCVIYHYGGIYTDADTICLSTPNDLIKDGYLVLAPELTHNLFCQWTFAAPPKSPVLKNVIDNSVERLRENKDKYKENEHFVHYYTGPSVFSDGINTWMNENKYNVSREFSKEEYKNMKRPIYVYDGSHFHKNMIRHLFTGGSGWKKEAKEYYLSQKNESNESFQNKYESQTIPKVIYMCCKDKKNIPTKVKQNWYDLNPNYKIELYDDKECHDYLVKEFGKEYGGFYNEIPFGPIKADLWRLCILYKNGGVYSDIDIHPLQSIDNIIANDSVTFCSVLSTFKNNIFQAFIYTTKGNTILKKCIDYMFEKRKLIQNTKNIGNPRGGFYWKISGTHDMYRTLKEELNVNNIESKIYKTSKQTIKILDEYTPGKTTKDCKVRFNGTDLLKSRYSDYKMYEHSF